MGNRRNKKLEQAKRDNSKVSGRKKGAQGLDILPHGVDTHLQKHEECEASAHRKHHYRRIEIRIFGHFVIIAWTLQMPCGTFS